RLVWRDCATDPAALSWQERLDLGINSNLPASVDEALDCLAGDEAMAELLGRELVRRYVAVKRAETELLRDMGADERRKWVIDRY
ncbi:hypothetical protein E4U41_003684, partial [Claviceps citrina]